MLLGSLASRAAESMCLRLSRMGQVGPRCELDRICSRNQVSLAMTSDRGLGAALARRCVICNHPRADQSG